MKKKKDYLYLWKLLDKETCTFWKKKKKEYGLKDLTMILVTKSKKVSYNEKQVTEILKIVKDWEQNKFKTDRSITIDREKENK